MEETTEQCSDSMDSGSSLPSQQISIDSQLLDINQQLYHVSETLEVARKGVLNYGLALNNSNMVARNYELAYLDERQRRTECA